MANESGGIILLLIIIITRTVSLRSLIVFTTSNLQNPPHSCRHIQTSYSIIEPKGTMPPKKRGPSAKVTGPIWPQPSRASKDEARKVIASAMNVHKRAPPKKYARLPRRRRRQPSPSLSPPVSPSGSDNGGRFDSFWGVSSLLSYPPSASSTITSKGVSHQDYP